MFHHRQDLRKGFTPSTLLQWLMEGDHYFILGHIHQGIEKWNVTELYQDLSWLRTRSGFPSHEQLSCPVWTQDKFEYIKGCWQITIPTLKVVLKTYNCADLTQMHEFSRGADMTVLDFTQVISHISLFHGFRLNCT